MRRSEEREERIGEKFLFIYLLSNLIVTVYLYSIIMTKITVKCSRNEM